MLTRRSFLSSCAVAPGMLLGGRLLQSVAAFAEVENAPHVSSKALAIHKRALVFDGHVHALDREFYQGGSIGTRKQDGYWDLPRALEGGVGAFFCSVYIPEEYYPSRFETKQAFRRVEHALEQLELNRDVVHLALNADDITRIRGQR